MRNLGILIFLFVIGLAGCGKDSNRVITPSPGATAYVKCADVYNEGDTSRCDPQPVAWYDALLPSANAATTVINGGTVTRDVLISTRADVVNVLATPITGYYEFRFDANCNSQPGDWVIAPKQKFTALPSATKIIGVGGQCGDMPLGARTFTATVWAEDGTTVLAVVVVNFTLI